MKISEVIEQLLLIKNEHGDLPCGICDADTDWELLLEKDGGIYYHPNGAVIFCVDFHGPRIFTED